MVKLFLGCRIRRHLCLEIWCPNKTNFNSVRRLFTVKLCTCKGTMIIKFWHKKGFLEQKTGEIHWSRLNLTLRDNLLVTQWPPWAVLREEFDQLVLKITFPFVYVATCNKERMWRRFVCFQTFLPFQWRLHLRFHWSLCFLNPNQMVIPLKLVCEVYFVIALGFFFNLAYSFQLILPKICGNDSMYAKHALPFKIVNPFILKFNSRQLQII